MRNLLSVSKVKLMAVLVVSAFLLSINVDKKFVGHHDWNSAVYSNVARNYLRYGLLTTKLGQVRNYDFANPEYFDYMTHYPPLLSLFIALSFRLFGISEVSARLVPITATLGVILLIYLVGKEIYDKELGFIASLYTTVTPIVLYFGKLPVHETVVPVFSLLSLLGYIKLVKTKNYLYYWVIVLGVILGGLVNWTGYYIAISMIIDGLWHRKEVPFFKSILFLFFLCSGLFFLHLLHLKILTGSLIGGGLVNILITRANPYLTQDIYEFTLKKYIIQEFNYLRIYMTNWGVLLAFFGFIQTFFILRKEPTNLPSRVIIMLFIYGSIHLVLFPNLVFIHDYMIYYLIPFFAISFAFVIRKIFSFFPIKFFGQIAFLLIMLSITFERRTYVHALLTSEASDKGYEIGSFIKRETGSGDKAFVGSDHFKEFYEVFIGFYSDREVGYGEKVTLERLKSFSLIIRPKAHDALNQDVKNYLDSNYPRFENSNYIWYDLRPKNKI